LSKKNITYMMLIISLFLILNGSTLQAKETDLMDEIINSTGSNVVEYGVSASYITNNMEIETLKDTLRTLGYYDSKYVSISESENVYTIDFIKGNVYGFIEAANENNVIYVTIDVKEKNTQNNVNLLKKNIEGVIEKKYTEVKYYLYLKSKIKENNLSIVNDQIYKILKTRGAKNIDTVEIDKGFSTVAYTKRYETIKNNGVLMDFNYAVTAYDSGNYIIIGTPTINVTY
jgi:hypothetical protein